LLNFHTSNQNVCAFHYTAFVDNLWRGTCMTQLTSSSQPSTPFPTMPLLRTKNPSLETIRRGRQLQVFDYMRRYVCFPCGLYHHTYMVVRGEEAEDEVILRGSFGASIRHRSSPSKKERLGCTWAIRLFWGYIRKPTRWSRLLLHLRMIIVPVIGAD
jgi:hypothetical protein